MSTATICMLLLGNMLLTPLLSALLLLLPFASGYLVERHEILNGHIYTVREEQPFYRVYHLPHYKVSRPKPGESNGDEGPADDGGGGSSRIDSMLRQALLPRGMLQGPRPPRTRSSGTTTFPQASAATMPGGHRTSSPTPPAWTWPVSAHSSTARW